MNPTLFLNLRNLDQSKTLAQGAPERVVTVPAHQEKIKRKNRKNFTFKNGEF